MKKILKFCCIALASFALQACSSPTSDNSESTASNTSDSIMPKEFGDRFSSEKIKQKREAVYLQKRLELKRKDPVEDANSALKNNDVYLIGIPASRAAGRSFPGLVEPQALNINCRTVMVEGMGDSLYGKNHIMYRQELLQYMRNFNAIMAAYCK